MDDIDPHGLDSEKYELYITSTGRAWPRETVDRFVVGRIHGRYDMTESWLYLSIAYPEFADVTMKEVQYFWNDLLPRTKILNKWRSKNDRDSEVKKILEDIKPKMNEALEILREFRSITCPASRKPSEINELYDKSTGRVWPRELIDRIVVGRTHGRCDWTETWLHVSNAYPEFADVTNDDLKHFWYAIIPTTDILPKWSSKTLEDAEVKKILNDIRAAMDGAIESLKKVPEMSSGR